MRPPLGFPHSPNKESSSRLCQPPYEIWQASSAWFVKFSSSTISQFEYSTTFYNSTFLICLTYKPCMHCMVSFKSDDLQAIQELKQFLNQQFEESKWRIWVYSTTSLALEVSSLNIAIISCRHSRYFRVYLILAKYKYKIYIKWLSNTFSLNHLWSIKMKLNVIFKSQISSTIDYKINIKATFFSNYKIKEFVRKLSLVCCET